MTFLLDNHFPVQIAMLLRQLGHQCDCAADLKLDEADDVILWNHATAAGQVLVSKDEDFVFLANRRGDTGRMVWVRLGNCRNHVLLAAFTRVHADIIRALDAGQRIVEVR